MATYVYETIPKKKGQKPRRFECQQRMSDPPLKKEPKTGVPVRRVIIGGSGLVSDGAAMKAERVRKSKWQA